MTQPDLPGSGKTNPYSGKPWRWRPYTLRNTARWTKTGQQYEFDPGWSAAFFIESTLRHTKGRWRGRPFHLYPFQLATILGIFGPVDKWGHRIVRKAWLEYARKNGKSELAAAIALKLLFADRENAAEVYGAASDRDQASLVFNVAASMVELSEPLSKAAVVRRSGKRIIAPKSESFYVAIPADVAGSHGFNASGIIFDEVHTQPNRALWDVLETSMGVRDQPLIFAITTAGTDHTSIAGELHNYADQVQRGVIKDKSWYVDIRNTPQDADWRVEKNWQLSNPALGTRSQVNKGKGFRSIEEMRQFAKEANRRPAAQTTFRNLYLNQWTQSRSQWLDLHQWDQGGAKGTLWLSNDLDDQECYVGLDLAATRDVTAYALLFPTPHLEAVRVMWRYFLPRKWLTDNPHHPLTTWANQSRIIITEGDIIDFDAIEQRLRRDAERFRFKELGYDPWQSTMLVQRLADSGMTTVKVPQGPATLTSPTKEVERLVAQSKLHHNNDPVARWMADNCVVHTNGDQVRLVKDKAMDKIDGITALVNAVERWMHAEEPSELNAYWL